MSTIIYPPSSSATSQRSLSISSGTSSSAEKSIFHVVSPISNQVFVTRAYATSREFRDTLRRARDAYIQWKNTDLSERCRLILNSLKYFRNHSQEIAEELTHLIGRPIKSTPREIHGYISRAEYLIKIAPKALADIYVNEDDESGPLDTTAAPYSITHNDEITGKPFILKKLVKKEPFGIMAVISAWNFPYLIALKAAIPALLAGNVVILKSSAQTPTIAERMVQSFIEAGIPNGVLQYLHLTHQGTESLVKHQMISLVQYTGSVDGGKAIMSATSNKFIETYMELGGCDAALVRSDADLQLAVIELVDGAFFNSGQCCCGIQRIYIHDSIYNEFVSLFKEQTIKQYGNIGNPLDDSTTLGPCVKASAADTLRDLISEDIAAGAVNIMANSGIGKNLDIRGSAYLSPIVLTQVTSDMHVQKEELFGPIVSLTKVSSDEEAIQYINNNPFGLTASVWTADNNIVQDHIGSMLQVGTVYQNKCDTLDPSLPWTATKDSGKGVSMSIQGFDSVTRPKSVYLRHFVYDNNVVNDK